MSICANAWNLIAARVLNDDQCAFQYVVHRRLALCTRPLSQQQIEFCSIPLTNRRKSYENQAEEEENRRGAVIGFSVRTRQL